jgi:hypothetical protein
VRWSTTPERLLHFPAGLIGLPTLRHFIVMPNRKEGPLFWIQSVDEPEMAFVLTDPTNFFLDYRVVPDAAERQTLRIEEGDDCFVLVVVTVPPTRRSPSTWPHRSSLPRRPTGHCRPSSTRPNSPARKRSSLDCPNDYKNPCTL